MAECHVGDGAGNMGGFCPTGGTIFILVNVGGFPLLLEAPSRYL